MRVGIGVDVHRLVKGRPLVLGGVLIPFEKGLLGHSDADVLIHAICDALLGAAGLGDIGMHFPDTDPAYKDIDSTRLLARVRDMLAEKRYGVENLDATVIAEAPKIGPYRDKMAETISGVLRLEKDRVNIKATTTEALGFVGQGEGIVAICTAAVFEIHSKERS